MKGAPKGNQFWRLRSKHGRDTLFATPEALWEGACEYFQWVDNNPWHKVEQVKMPVKGFFDGDTGTFIKPDLIVKIPTERPYTLQGLCRYLDCDTKYFNYFEKSLQDKKDKKSKDFLNIVTRIRETCFQQKFEGAAVGAFNASIIARELGLTDKVDTTIANPDGTPIGITLKL